MSPAENNYRNTVKKFVVAKRLIKKDAILKRSDTEFKRINPSDSIYTSYLEDFVGKKACKNIKRAPRCWKYSNYRRT